MTDDEIIFAANNAFGTLEEYRAQLENRMKTRCIKAYGDKVMRIVRVDVAETHGGGFHMRYWGPVLKNDGTPNKAISGYSQRVEDAEFID